MIRWIPLAALAVTLGASSPPSKFRAPSSCLVRGDLPALRCSFYPKVAEPKLYFVPSGGQAYVEPGWDNGHPWPGYLNDFVADPDDLDAGAAFVRIYHLNKPLRLWVDRKDIVRYSDLKKVKGCWPIHRLLIESGDAPQGTVTLGRDGIGRGDADSNLTGRVQAWYLDGVWSVRVIGRTARFRGDAEAGWGNLDLASRKVIGRASWSGGEELDPNMPASCASGPIVD